LAGVPASGLWFEFGICELGEVASGVCDCDPDCDPDCVEDGVWLLLSGIDGDWLGEVDGVCCDGVVSGEEEGCCA